MRITGGLHRGRRLKTPGMTLRPTQDRVREAVCSILAERIAEAVVIDLYAGSGAFGFECLSRGAAQVAWVESNAKHARCIKQNLEELGEVASPHYVTNMTVERWWNQALSIQADIVFADPPYDKYGLGKQLQNTLSETKRSSILTPNGCLVFEQSVKEPVLESEGWALKKNKKYGGTRILIFQHDEVKS